ncbi:MAG: hypothetical protein BGO97_12180 [Micrococcales bacterium 70-64]|nr:M23 family metallopeptidase [Leifsonia sp.]ODU64717.1 MAG: hypothetical protein ABT06_12180 [Leifsonia sp. SCN 70-46]OJX86408.1 MAG: hypothetical protein BGO97_12180 [Micrococcales bacterium 70-64]
MLTTPRSSFPAARKPSEPRLVGILNANRRVLVIGAILASGVLTSIPTLPAEADSFLGITAADAEVPGQTFAASASVLEAPVARDAFGITTYSVVQWPVPADTPISSGFGFRECDGCATDHKGTDFNPGSGYPIQVIADGIVTAAGWDSTGYGYMVTVQHVIDGQVVTSLYAHMLDGSIAVTAGQTVTRGTVLGLVGSTGESTGAHLHLGILVGDTFVDPMPWMLAHVNI